MVVDGLSALLTLAARESRSAAIASGTVSRVGATIDECVVTVGRHRSSWVGAATVSRSRDGSADARATEVVPLIECALADLIDGSGHQQVLRRPPTGA